MQELKFEDLSVKQKIGMVTCGIFAPGRNREHDHSVYELIKNHALGCVWVQRGIKDFEEVMAKLKERDEVAYVRFASVYREFKDIDTFLKELNVLKGNE